MIGSDCMTCVHLHQGGKTCTAYKVAIPNPIFVGEQRHLDPTEGDHGIVWAPKPGFEFMDIGPNAFVGEARV